jgi:hypothetical protein
MKLKIGKKVLLLAVLASVNLVSSMTAKTISFVHRVMLLVKSALIQKYFAQAVEPPITECYLRREIFVFALISILTIYPRIL